MISPRQRQVLYLLANGYTDKEIAVSLGISRHTVSEYIRRGMRALGSTTREESIARAVALGLIVVDIIPVVINATGVMYIRL